MDDIWGVWDDTDEDWMEFVETLNAHHPSIRVKWELELEGINFLDTTVYKGPDFLRTGRLDTKVYFKPTDTHALLHRGSHHAAHVFKGIVKAQLLRFRRICTREGDRVEAVNILMKALRRRGYSRYFLRRAAREEKISKKRILVPHKKVLPFIVTFSDTARRLAMKIKRNYERRSQDKTLGAQCRMVTAFKKGKNLQDLLVHSKLRPAGQTAGTKSGEILLRGKHRAVYRIPRNIALNQKNCIYLIKCSWCGKRYVGETGNSILTRMWGHRHTVKKGTQRKGHVVPHFQRHGVGNMKVCGLEHNSTWNKRDRMKRESYWIRKLDTWFPKGLNMK